MNHLDDASHLCIVLLTGLGDVVHGLPLVNALKDRNPRLRITWVAEPMPAQLIAGHASIDRVVVYRRADGMRGVSQLAKDLRAGDPIGVTLNLNVYFKSIWPTLLSRSPRRIGFDRARAHEGVWLAANEHLDPRPRAHTADMFLEFASRLGIGPVDPQWRIKFTADEMKQRREFFRQFDGRPVATLIPASGSIKKDWLTSRWVELANALDADFGFNVAVAGGPGEREQRIAREILDGSSARLTLAMGDSVRRLAAIVGGSNIVIAPDTGPVHIARALDVPVVGIYGHTNPWRVGPWRAYHDLWVDHYTDDGVAPDASNRTPKWNRMQTITAAEVLERVAHAIDHYDVARHVPRAQ